jgi:hypothetical protein
MKIRRMDNDCKQVSPYVYGNVPLSSFRFFPTIDTAFFACEYSFLSQHS